MLNPRWVDPELVAEFAAREPDHRLVSIVGRLAPNARPRFLDLGCAAGRNALYLAERGFDVHATDLSVPMTELTRQRLAEVVGEEEANARVHTIPMTDLSVFDDASFDFVIALGIHQQATSLDEWEEAMRETVRVMRPDALMLVAHFGVGTDLTGEHGAPLGPPHLYEIREGHPSVLFTAEELDAKVASHGLVPLEPTETVRRPHEPAGTRVTLNALYTRRLSS